MTSILWCGRTIPLFAARCQYSLKKPNPHLLPRRFVDRLKDLLLHRKLVFAVAQRHKGALEGVAVDRCFYFYQTAGSEECSGLGPDDVSPATWFRALEKLGLERFVQHGDLHLVP